MKRVAIVGLGLMGGSLGLALRRRGFPGSIAGYARRRETRDEALAAGAVDEVHDDPAAVVRDADMVVICVPILATAPAARACAPGLRPGTVVTDVGSTKAALDGDMDEALADTGARFVGSHPIAGSERQGIDGARADLYHNATVVVTPRPGRRDAPETVAVDRLWAAVGARVVHLPATLHDEILARTSHLPHMIAAVLAATVGRDSPVEGMDAFCGTGYRDTTRIAAGSPAVWMDIIRSNRTALVEELDACRMELEQLTRRIRQHQDQETEAFLQRAQDIRNAIGPSGSESGD